VQPVSTGTIDQKHHGKRLYRCNTLVASIDAPADGITKLSAKPFEIDFVSLCHRMQMASHGANRVDKKGRAIVLGLSFIAVDKAALTE
jgi:hypothetical protein